MFKKSLLFLIFVPHLSFANACIHLFSEQPERLSLKINSLLEQLESGKALNTESLYHLKDLVNASPASLAFSGKAKGLLLSLMRHNNTNLRYTSFDLLTKNFEVEVNFFDFFKTKSEINKYLNKRQRAFEDFNQGASAAEIISVFKNYTLDKSIKLTEFLKIFDHNGYFYISVKELQKILIYSSTIYTRVLQELKKIDSRIHPDQLYQIFKNKKIIEENVLVFKITLEAIEQQKIKLKKSDFQFLVNNIEVNTKQALVWTEVLSYINRYPNTYLSDFVGESGFLIPLLSKVSLDNTFGRMLYQELFISLKRFEYEMTPEELQLGFSPLISYKPMLFSTQTKLTSFFRYEFESPVELFYNYLSSQPRKMFLSQKKHAVQILKQNLITAPFEASFVHRLEQLIEN